MNQIIDPGNHWHKDYMPYEEPRPGITEPNYDEHFDPNEPEYPEFPRQNWDNDVPF